MDRIILIFLITDIIATLASIFVIVKCTKEIKNKPLDVYLSSASINNVGGRENGVNKDC